MFEKIKSGILLFLIFLSIFLTYKLWFGQPPLEEETVPHYEDIYFTVPPLPSRIILPSKIIYCDDKQGIHFFPRGCKGFEQLCNKGLSIIKEKADLQNAKRISISDLDGLITTFSSRLVYHFDPSIPMDFILEPPVFEEMPLEEAVFLWDEESLYVVFQGEENLLLPLGGVDNLKKALLPDFNKPHRLLPPLLELDLSPREGNEGAPDNEGTPDIEEEAGGQGNFIVNEGEGIIQNEGHLSWKIEIKGDIYVPEEDILAAEVSLKEEEIDHEQFVRAFFIDLSLARRIEERDGAIYYTDGEKGLRIYASGLVEFAFPRLERNLSGISYSLALQKAAESLSLYGGWPPGIYLDRVDNLGRGYSLLWGPVSAGLAFKGEQTGCEMEIDEQGVSYYRRNIYSIEEDVSERKPFRSYEEALWRVLSLEKERFREKNPVLLLLEPVYYLPPSGGVVKKAIPAWAVRFEGMEVKYLHWNTLEPL
ncbi:MAG TPA: hypothetical protein GX004_02205 [Firmicutes bacterium]|nr:hypothetical protein [Bacillota bacterium]